MRFTPLLALVLAMAAPPASAEVSGLTEQGFPAIEADGEGDQQAAQPQAGGCRDPTETGPRPITHAQDRQPRSSGGSAAAGA